MLKAQTHGCANPTPSSPCPTLRLPTTAAVLVTPPAMARSASSSLAMHHSLSPYHRSRHGFPVRLAGWDPRANFLSLQVGASGTVIAHVLPLSSKEAIVDAAGSGNNDVRVVEDREATAAVAAGIYVLDPSSFSFWKGANCAAAPHTESFCDCRRIGKDAYCYHPHTVVHVPGHTSDWTVACPKRQRSPQCRPRGKVWDCRAGASVTLTETLTTFPWCSVTMQARSSRVGQRSPTPSSSRVASPLVHGRMIMSA